MPIFAARLLTFWGELLKALQYTLDCNGLLTENNKNQFRTHPSQRMDSRSKRNDFALHF